MFAGKQARTQRRLQGLSATIADLRTKLAVAEEQVVFLSGVEADARTDAVVADNQLASREHATASSDLGRAIRERDELKAAIAKSLSQQDALLDGLLEGRPPG